MSRIPYFAWLALGAILGQLIPIGVEYGEAVTSKAWSTAMNCPGRYMDIVETYAGYSEFSDAQEQLSILVQLSEKVDSYSKRCSIIGDQDETITQLSVDAEIFNRRPGTFSPREENAFKGRLCHSMFVFLTKQDMQAVPGKLAEFRRVIDYCDYRV